MSKRYFEARKTLSKERDLDVETIKVSVVDIEDEFIFKEVENFVEDVSDYDFEDLYYKGIFFNWDEWSGIEVDRFNEFLEDKLKDEIEDYGDESRSIDIWKKLLEELKKWEGYTFYVEERKDEV